MSKEKVGKKKQVFELRGGTFHPSEIRKANQPTRSISVEETQVGFKVRLKSGGPEMTIIRVLSNNVCECRWNSGEELKDQVSRFPAASLTPAMQN